MKVCVTGGSGGAGGAVVENLVERGVDVINIDREKPQRWICPHIETDLLDYAAVRQAVEGADMIAHFAGNPQPDFNFADGADRFENNTLSCFNVFNAAADAGIKRVVWASSETVYGFPFENNVPLSAPCRESDPISPQNAYAISKAASEFIASEMNRLYGISFIGLRLSNVLYPVRGHHASYYLIPGYWDDPLSRKFNLWSYVDCRDVAKATWLALNAELDGAEVFNVAARDTLMQRDNSELLELAFDVPVRQDFAFPRASFLDISKAERLLGYSPDHGWSDVIDV
ncbi:NAD(P)-dependent oxidoreductase [Nitratireductor sp. XY-223]|uniref:NAD-dependent epimerase/dehydratase family protein n=1 Tax=Nitratireductor sp. XY-223 TaxID=2561926 RepID=UPI0010AA5F8F|nr:NAD(P)-dependent oxidoreductase [Nitratireductor sp. XY-223]